MKDICTIKELLYVHLNVQTMPILLIVVLNVLATVQKTVVSVVKSASIDKLEATFILTSNGETFSEKD